MTVKEWFEMRERKMSNLEKAYNYRFDNLPLNDYGEVIAENLLKLNKWAEGEKERINATMAGMVPDLES